MQEADVLGKTFMFQAQESRDIADISRQAGMVQQYGQQRADALGAMGKNTGAVLGAFAGGRGEALGKKVFGGD